MASTLFSPGTVYTSAWGNETDKATHNYLTAVAGTNTITATGPTSSVGYVAGDRYFFVPANANSGAVTININSLGAKNVTKYGATALVANDLITAEVFEVIYDGVQFQLLNPRNTDVSVITGTLPVTNGGTGATTGSQALINLGATGRLIGIQRFTAGGTYTPTVGTTSIIVEAVGGGGQGGGSAAPAAGQVSVGGGGGSGGYTRGRFTTGFAPTTAITIGAGGTGGGAGTVGGAGGTTSFGALLTANGGAGGAVSAAAVAAAGGGGIGAAVSGTGGNVLAIAGQTGTTAFSRFGDGAALSGAGGSSQLGPGAASALTATAIGGTVSSGSFGSGGSGAASVGAAGAATGGGGSAGLVVVYEYS